MFPQRERKFSPVKDAAGTLERLFRVALGETSQVLCALGSWHICSCTMCIAAWVGVKAAGPLGSAGDKGL